MKRYRICAFDFDARANLLNQPTEGWSEEAKANLKKQIQQIEQEIINEFGTIDKIAKIKRFKEIGAKSLSIIAHHNFLHNQIRSAYVQGNFYPALTSACALGERILNHLVLDLREDYDDGSEEPNEHSGIFTCKSCSSWNLMINTLTRWGIFNSNIKNLFKELSKKRHKSLHFNEGTINNLGDESLGTIKILQEIIQKLFPAFGGDYFIPTKGETYLKKELESKPFFKKYYLPNSKLVSPYHKVIKVRPRFIIEDIDNVEDKEVSDNQFIKLREKFLATKTC